MAAGFVSAVYAMFGGVVWSAYDEFGHQSLLNLAPLVLADRAPLKLPPGEGAQDRTVLPGPAGNDRSSATALASDERPGPALRQSASPMASSLDTGQGDKIDTLVLAERPAMAPYGTEPAAGIGTSGSEGSVTAALETPPIDVRAAAPLGSAAPAFSDQMPPSRPAATWPPAPAFKPLDAVATVMAQAMLPPVRSNTKTSELGDSPPVPSLKPMVMASEQQPGRATEQKMRRVAATRPTLPDALRAFWTNLKILLASGPTPRVLRAGGDDSDRSDNQPGVRSDLAHAGSGGDGRTSGGISRSSGGGDNGGSSGGGSSSSSGSGSSSNNGGGGSAKGGGGVSVGGVSVGGGVSIGGGGKRGGDKGGHGGKGGSGRGGGKGKDSGKGKGGSKGKGGRD